MNRKLTFKLLSSYLIIVIMSISVLYVTTVIIITRSFEKQAISHNMAMIQQISDVFYLKSKNLKNAVAQLYASSTTSNTKSDIWALLKTESRELPYGDYKRFRLGLLTFLNENCLGIDNDLLYVGVLQVDSQKGSKKNNVVKSIYSESNVTFFLDDIISEKTNASIADQYDVERIHYVGAFEGAYDHLFLMYYQLVDPMDISKVIGYMVYAYQPDVLKNSYRTYSQNKIGKIMILTNTGSVIFDSEEQYNESIYPEFEEIQRIKNGSGRVGDHLINVVYQKTYDYYVVSIINDTELNQIKKPIRTIAIIGIVLFVILAVLFSTFTSLSLTKRVNVLLKTMIKVKNGDLNARANLDGSDEIHEIGEQFNLMCQSIENYIEREYLYQMRQKEAQIIALQSQVNPHFLYNALEAIRMKAILADDVDVSRMVVCLADIFRSNIKSEMVISVRQEIANCNSFLEFYNIRYDYGIELICDIDDSIYRCSVIRHLLQPIIENSIVHGLDLNRQDNILMIKASIYENEFIDFDITDNGKGIELRRLEQIQKCISESRERNVLVTPNKSVGIVNVHERIQLIYGNECGLTIGNRVDALGTCVKIRIRFKTIEELKKDVQRVDCR